MAFPQRADDVVRLLNLSPHPEGGYYREVFRSKEQVNSTNVVTRRSASTAIYYLLRFGEFSSLHRVCSDEAWHFYAGRPLELVWLTPENVQARALLGNELGSGQRPLAVVPAGSWQAATTKPEDMDTVTVTDDEAKTRDADAPAQGADYSLVGCTVAPGFDFKDFEMPTRAELHALLPGHERWVDRFTR